MLHIVGCCDWIVILPAPAPEDCEAFAVTDTTESRQASRKA